MKSAVSRVASLKEKVESQAGDLKMLQASRAEAAVGEGRPGGAGVQGPVVGVQGRCACCSSTRLTTLDRSAWPPAGRWLQRRWLIAT